MSTVTENLGKSLARLGQIAQNALEVARFGGLETGEESTPHAIVARHPMYRLRRYGDETLWDGPRRSPIILVPPMMLAADVWDVSPQATAVGELLKAGLDPWVVDFGAPEKEEGGLERTLTDHVVALSNAVDEVIEITGGDVHLSGYSQGGMFCYQAAAYRRAEGLASIITYGSPVDQHAAFSDGMDEALIDIIDFMADKVLPSFSIPAWLSRLGFRMMDPIGAVRNQVEFALQLHDRDSLLPREGQRRFLMNDGWVTWPGPALAELAKQFMVSNRMVSGGFVIDGRVVTLADIECPILAFIGTKDDLAPPDVVRAVAQAAPATSVYESELEAGHFGLVVGSRSVEVTWPTVGGWVRWQEHGGDQPDNITLLDPEFKPKRERRSDAERAINVAANLATGVGRTVINSVRGSMRNAVDLTSDTVGQVGRLNRIDRVRPETHISLASLFTEQATAAPKDTAFLFEGRGHTYAAANERIDNVVRGLIKIGVRRGAHIGVLMNTRPSALGVVVALNRIGAVAVLLRPDGSLEREIALGRVTRIVADPENGRAAAEVKSIPLHILGGGGGPRDLGSAVDDMEAIDPAAVPVPGWYEPDPGRARDLAFILFTGSGEQTRVNRITNGRWALSAFGTATSASLTRADTVLSLTPIHHPSALLTGIGAALAGRARLAMTRGFDAETFWDDVRRYGATAVTYTWTMAADILDAPASAKHVSHPIRLFIGSGMPSGLWQEVQDRLAPARVLEFYASTEGDAVLVNVKGTKVGSLGRRLPGSAQLAVAKYDIESGRLVEGADGFAVACKPGEVGMLLARLSVRDGAFPDRALRALFEGGDAWLPTGDLFRVDTDGDHWLVGGVQSLIHTPHGAVPPIPVQDALATIEGVRLSVVHAVEEADGTTAVGAAVVLHPDCTLTPDALDAGVACLPQSDRPRYVRVVEEIPRTTWFRVKTGELRAQGVPRSGPGLRLGSDGYEPLGTTKVNDSDSTAPKKARVKQAASKKPAADKGAATKRKTTTKRVAKPTKRPATSSSTRSSADPEPS